MRPQSGPGSGPYWNGSRSRPSLVHGFLNNLCTAVTSCFSVFCCCWLLEDCFTGRRRFPGPPIGSLDEPPLPPPDIGPQPHGLMGSIFSGPSPPQHSVYAHRHEGLMGSLVEGPPPPDVGPRHHGLLGSVIGGPPGPPSQPGPLGYPGEPSPYG